ISFIVTSNCILYLDEVFVTTLFFPSLEVNACVGITCENSGTCVSTAGTYTCECAGGFEGTFCQNNTNDCVGNSCLNQGICVDGVGGYTCTCLQGFAGQFCQEEIDECLSLPCENEGTCVNLVNQFKCNCAAGYTGIQCADDINECASSPCRNDATCMDGVNGYVCDCVQGFTGTWCSTNINDCSPNPCLNGGTCIDGVNSATCTCTVGHTGDNCRPAVLGDSCFQRVDICANIANAECSGAAVCVCSAGYLQATADTCSAIDCGNLPPPDNGAVDHADGTSYNDIVVFTCDTGYLRNGASSLTCKNDGTWSGTAPTCDDCGVPASTANGAVNYVEGTLVGAEATYTCDNGYQMSGSARSECQTDGTWSRHGICFVVNVAYDEVCFETAQCITTGATCRNDGLGSIKCLCAASGEQYDTNIDECLSDCGQLPNPTDGEVSNPDVTAEGQIATYTCFTGYGLVGDKRRTCQSDGHWSGAPPVCSFDCPLLGNIVNGKVDMSYGRHEGSLATFACNSNYALVGDPVVKCESSGVWGGIQPTCVFAMFPDIILAFGVIMVILIIIDMFIVGLCLYYKYFKLKKQKFAKVKPEGAHPPPAHPDEPNVVYRSTMKMDNSVLSNIFSKGGKYNRPEDDEKSLYHDDEKTNDNGYMSQSVSQEDDLDITHMSKTPRDAKPIKEEPEGDEDEESGDRGRFWFHMRAPPANIKDTLQSAENEGGNHADAKIRSTSAAPAYKPNKRH
ncbi:SVEP1-like protein, partial [Mya arenaria]